MCVCVCVVPHTRRHTRGIHAGAPFPNQDANLPIPPSYLLPTRCTQSWNEVSKPHYLTEGGRTGAAKVPFGWDPANLMDTFKKTNTYKGKTRTMEELKAASRTSELKNGR